MVWEIKLKSGSFSLHGSFVPKYNRAFSRPCLVQIDVDCVVANGISSTPLFHLLQKRHDYRLNSVTMIFIPQKSPWIIYQCVHITNCVENRWLAPLESFYAMAVMPISPFLLHISVDTYDIWRLLLVYWIQYGHKTIVIAWQKPYLQLVAKVYIVMNSDSNTKYCDEFAKGIFYCLSILKNLNVLRACDVTVAGIRIKRIVSS